MWAFNNHAPWNRIEPIMLQSTQTVGSYIEEFRGTAIRSLCSRSGSIRIRVSIFKRMGGHGSSGPVEEAEEMAGLREVDIFTKPSFLNLRRLIELKCRQRESLLTCR